MAELEFAQLRKAIQALSSVYVERRGALAAGAALDSAGKRAAFALFYGPLHFLLVRRIIGALRSPSLRRIVDLGCGTGVAGAAWALECAGEQGEGGGAADAAGSRAAGRVQVSGVDRNTWAVAEARWTHRALGLRGQVRRATLERTPLPGAGSGIVLAYALNELDPAVRSGMLGRVMEAAKRGAALLVIEPISARSVPWWNEWASEFKAAGGRADSWRFPADLPERLRQLDRAAGLDHQYLTGRSLWLTAGGAGRPARRPDRRPAPGQSAGATDGPSRSRPDSSACRWAER